MNTLYKTSLYVSFAAAGVWFGSIFAAADNRSYEVPEINYDLVSEVDVESVWRASCAGCHGRDGKGQTRVGRRAGVKDLTDHQY